MFFHSRCLSVASPLIEVVAGILDEDDILFHERENAKRRGHSALGNIAGPADTAAERQQKGSEERMEFFLERVTRAAYMAVASMMNVLFGFSFSLVR